MRLVKIRDVYFTQKCIKVLGFDRISPLVLMVMRLICEIVAEIFKKFKVKGRKE